MRLVENSIEIIIRISPYIKTHVSIRQSRNLNAKRRGNNLENGTVRPVKASLLVTINISSIRDRNIGMTIRINRVRIIMYMIRPAISVWDFLCKTYRREKQAGYQCERKKRGAFSRFHIVSLKL
jgi:hypothetical protein